MMSREETLTEKEWIHSGLKCKVNFYKTKSTGYNWRCGYVGLAKNHPCFQVSYDDIPVSVHGGLTYSNVGKDGLYWVGFDCIHAGDRHEGESEDRGHFWLLDEVVEETNRLAEQLTNVSIKEIFDKKLQYMPDWFKNHVQFTLERDCK